MHRSSFSLGRSSSALHHLGEDTVRSITTSDGLAMDTVSGDKAIIASHTSFHSDSNGFLSIVQMAESTDFFLFVEQVRNDFNTAHGDHLFEVVSHLFGVSSSSN